MIYTNIIKGGPIRTVVNISDFYNGAELTITLNPLNLKGTSVILRGDSGLESSINSTTLTLPETNDDVELGCWFEFVNNSGLDISIRQGIRELLHPLYQGLLGPGWKCRFVLINSGWIVVSKIPYILPMPPVKNLLKYLYLDTFYNLAVEGNYYINNDLPAEKLVLPEMQDMIQTCINIVDVSENGKDPKEIPTVSWEVGAPVYIGLPLDDTAEIGTSFMFRNLTYKTMTFTFDPSRFALSFIFQMAESSTTSMGEAKVPFMGELLFRKVTDTLWGVSGDALEPYTFDNT